MNQYFSKPCKSPGGNVNVKHNLFNYATKADLERATFHMVNGIEIYGKNSMG